MGLFSSSHSYIGVDIGTSGVKIVELLKKDRKISLLTYGFSEIIDYELSGGMQKDIKEIAKIINEVLKKSGATSRNAIASLPTFSVFSSVVALSGVEKKDIASAINWEAKKVIPLPLEEMVLDWVLLSEPDEEKKSLSRKVLITGAPRALVERYINIFRIAQVNLLSLETETLSLVRALMGQDKSIISIIEIGTNTTDISIIENGVPILSRSIDVGGLTITKAVSRNLNIGLNRAEQFKYDMGISSLDSAEGIPKAIIDSISPIISEVQFVANLYQSKSGKSIEKAILSGGSSMLLNLSQYFEQCLKLKVIVGDPWSRVSYPVELEPTLKELGPRLAVAIGLAMREQ
jgi:type IV pilus assembly protein PilM